MPGFLMTNTGTAAFIAAGGLGPKVDISHFRVGPDSTAEGYIPAVTDTDIPTPFLTGYGLPVNGYLPVVNYVAVDATHAAYTLRMDQSIGTFDFGSLALYQETAPLTYVCVAVYAFDSRIKKQILTMTDAGNVIEITATLELANINNLTVNVAIVNPAPANMIELDSPDQLTIPSVAPVNTYILNGSGSPYGLDTEGNSIIAYKNDTDFWTYSTHLHEFYTGTVTSATATSLTDMGLGTTLTTGFALGMYIVVFTTGLHKGVSRMVTATGVNTIDWATSTGAAVAPGDTYSVYIANVEFSGGTTSGSNTYKLVVATALQTVFDTFPVLAEQMTCYFGSAFQPPTDYVITPSNPYEITFGVGVPLSTRVHFIARTLDYSTVIAGGTTGQALIKNSNANGDYSWATLTSGSNNYVKVTAVNSGDGYQYVFNIAPVYADSALVFVGSAFQPPEASVYTITGVNQITFSVGSGVLAGTDVFFVEKVSAYLGIIPGGNTGQVLAKNSATAGDYAWITNPGAVPSPANPADDNKVLTASGGSYSWVAPVVSSVPQVLLSTLSITAVSTLNFGNIFAANPAYKTFWIVVEDAKFTAGSTDLQLRYSDDAGATYESGASYYAWQAREMRTNTATETTTSDATASKIVIDVTGPSCLLQATIKVFNAASATNLTVAKFESMNDAPASSFADVVRGVGSQNTASVITGFQLSVAAGTFVAGGSVRVYGSTIPF